MLAKRVLCFTCNHGLGLGFLFGLILFGFHSKLNRRMYWPFESLKAVVVAAAACRRAALRLLIHCVLCWVQAEPSSSDVHASSTRKPIPRKRTFSDSRIRIEPGLMPAYWSKSANEGEE